MKVLSPKDTGARLPIKLWSNEDLSSEDPVFQQFRNLADHPLSVKWIGGMPDYHLGYGMPIGGVLVTRGGVVPNAVGVDIGCGMIAARLEVSAEALPKETLEQLRQAIHQRVPVGFKSHAEKQALPTDLRGALSDLPDGNIRTQVGKAESQIGTLGGGNHFIEIQRDAADDRVWVMIHSGSRNVGKTTCDYYHTEAKQLMKDYASSVPDLAFLPRSSQLYDDYLAEMRWCLSFAEHNRTRMLKATLEAFRSVLGRESTPDLVVETHHNFAAMEHHYGENVLVHRKGAVKAEGLVTIPGSMGTASYIGRGLDPVESFNTCSHGAGRAMGRKEANRTITHEEAEKAMEHVVFGVREGDYDEMPRCYKDIEDVMAAQADLVEPVHRLLPLAVVKG